MMTTKMKPKAEQSHKDEGSDEEVEVQASQSPQRHGDRRLICCVGLIRGGAVSSLSLSVLFSALGACFRREIAQEFLEISAQC